MAFKYAKFSSLFIGFALVTAGLYGFNKFVVQKGKLNFNPYNGLSILGAAILIGSISLYSYCSVIGFPSALIVTPIFKSLFTFVGLLFLLVSGLSYGNILKELFSLKLKKGTESIFEIGLGLMVITLFMFLTGTVGLLKNFILAPFLLIGIGLRWKYALEFCKKIFWEPFSKDHVVPNKVIIMGFVLLAFLTINFISNQIPFPPGFDSRNFYLNISNLMGQQGGIVKGFAPYNWSVLMSYGFVIFKSPEIAFGVSFLGFVLSMWAVYVLMRIYLKLPVFESLLVITAFAVTPSITNQLFVEYKIDFGLLFYQLICILLVLNIYEGKKSPISTDTVNKNLIMLFAFLGILTGFGLGIKLTNLYLVLALASFIWFHEGYFKGFFGINALILFFILITKFDDLSGLNKYHLGVSAYKYLFLGIGVILLGNMFMKRRKKFMKAFQISLIYGLATGLTFAPWMIKNAKDARGPISANKLLIGSNPGPIINMKVIDNNFQNQIKKGK